MLSVPCFTCASLQSRRPVERNVQGTKRPGNESSRKRNVQGTKRPLRTRNETSWERKVHKPQWTARQADAKSKMLFSVNIHGTLKYIFSARQHICYSALYAIARPSVRLSLCPSHGWISQRHLKLGSRNFHHRVAP